MQVEVKGTMSLNNINIMYVESKFDTLKHGKVLNMNNRLQRKIYSEKKKSMQIKPSRLLTFMGADIKILI